MSSLVFTGTGVFYGVKAFISSTFAVSVPFLVLVIFVLAPAFFFWVFFFCDGLFKELLSCPIQAGIGPGVHKFPPRFSSVKFANAVKKDSWLRSPDSLLSPRLTIDKVLLSNEKFGGKLPVRLFPSNLNSTSLVAFQFDGRGPLKQLYCNRAEEIRRQVPISGNGPVKKLSFSSLCITEE